MTGVRSLIFVIVVLFGLATVFVRVQPVYQHSPPKHDGQLCPREIVFNTSHEIEPAPSPVYTALADDCDNVYLDLGTNIGVQIRKLYEPSRYPAASVLPIFDRYFGAAVENDTSTWRRRVCAFGFEPAAIHSAYLMEMETALNRWGARVKIFTETAVSGSKGARTDGELVSATLALDNSPEHNYWGASVTVDPTPNAETMQSTTIVNGNAVRLLHFPTWFMRHIGRRKHSTSGKIVMKVDIEGWDTDLVLGLLREGALCFVDLIYIEHMDDQVVGRLNDLCKEMHCDTVIEKVDDESYHQTRLPFPVGGEADY